MDPTHPAEDPNRYRTPRPQRTHGYQDSQEQYWGSDNDQHYDDPQIAGPPAIDPQLQYGTGSPTILPPGTSIARLSEYKQAGYPGYGSSSSSQQPAPYYEQQPASSSEAHDFRAYDPANPYPHQYPNDEVQSPVHDRPRPEKKYLCTFEGCDRSKLGCGFTTLNDLERHGRSKHGDDGQYIECRHERCPDRGKRFPRRDNFVDHYWRVHGDGSSKEDMKAFALEKAKEWMVVKRAGGWTQR